MPERVRYDGRGWSSTICRRLALAAPYVLATFFPSTPAHADTRDLAAYLRARAAESAGAQADAARDYAAALAAAPDNPVVALRAYRQGLEIGDWGLADRALAALQRTADAPPDAAVQPLALAAAREDAAAARAALGPIAAGTLAPLVPALSGWIAFAERDDPFPALAAGAPDPVAKQLAAETRALLLIASGRADEGLAAVRALVGAGQGRGVLDLRLDAAQLLIAAHRRDAALTLLDGDDPVLARLRTRPGKGVRPTLASGVSRVLTRLAVELAGEEASPPVVALARAALRADPANDRARLLLADQLNRAGSSDAALASLDEVRPDSPFIGVARTSRVSVLQARGDADAALTAARDLAARADATPFDQQRYGDLLLAVHRADDAVRQYARVVAASPRASDAWLQYGGALDEAKRWPEARAALERAVALGPAEPLALNYLGYARIAHGEAIPESRAMLERASALKPDDASITDSLAWAYFQGGAKARALPMLERAAAGEPGNAVIAEHLGDAYWAAGRRYEARDAWREAALLAEGADAARLAIKIADGPAAAGPTP